MKNLKNAIALCLCLFTVNQLRAEDKYALQWKKSETYKVSGGVVNSNYWEVRNDSAIFSTGNIVINEPGKQQLKASINISKDGSLNASDQAIVYFILNESIAKSFVIKGDEWEDKGKSDFTFTANKSSALKINIVFKSLGSDRSWKLKDNSVKIEFLSKLIDPEIAVITHGSSAKITWKQKTATSSNYFIVECSTNGQDFMQAGLVVATRSGNTDNFSFINKVVPTETVYYRLKLRDFSGDEKQIGEVHKVMGDISLSNQTE